MFSEVTEVVKKLHGGRTPGVDQIHPEFLKTLDVVGLSWLTRLCSITRKSDSVPLDWQTGVVVPLFKKGDRRMCSNYRGTTVLSLPGQVPLHFQRCVERQPVAVAPVNVGVFSSYLSLYSCFILFFALLYTFLAQ